MARGICGQLELKYGKVHFLRLGKLKNSGSLESFLIQYSRTRSNDFVTAMPVDKFFRVFLSSSYRNDTSLRESLANARGCTKDERTL
jgi:hypothetical protein